MQNHIKQKCSIKTIEDVTGVTDNCPHCGSTIFYKWGVRSRLQRYKCKECNKTFNVLTKTPLARLRYKEMWKEYANDLINGVTIEKSAKHCNIANSTSFRWRHKMLKASQDVKAKKLYGIVEMVI